MGNGIYEKYSAKVESQNTARKVNWEYVKELAHSFHMTFLVGNKSMVLLLLSLRVLGFLFAHS